MSLIDIIARRKSIAVYESDGFDMAICTLNEFSDRKFVFRGLEHKYTGISGDIVIKLLHNEMDTALILYRYATKVKKYTDRNGVLQIQIKVFGQAGTLGRYNPLDVEMYISTLTN